MSARRRSKWTPTRRTLKIRCKKSVICQNVSNIVFFISIHSYFPQFPHLQKSEPWRNTWFSIVWSLANAGHSIRTICDFWKFYFPTLIHLYETPVWKNKQLGLWSKYIFFWFKILFRTVDCDCRVLQTRRWWTLSPGRCCRSTKRAGPYLCHEHTRLRYTPGQSCKREQAPKEQPQLSSLTIFLCLVLRRYMKIEKWPDTFTWHRDHTDENICICSSIIWCWYMLTDWLVWHLIKKTPYYCRLYSTLLVDQFCWVDTEFERFPTMELLSEIAYVSHTKFW